MSAKSLNKVMLIGNLTRDPELKYTPQGTAVCTLGLATNRSWKDASGQVQEDTQFHRLVAWGKLAEICGQILQKGRKTYIQGRLQTRKWQGQDGQDRQATEVVVDEMIALGAPRGGGEGAGGGYGASSPMKTRPAPSEEVFSVDDVSAGVMDDEPEKVAEKKSTGPKKTTSGAGKAKVEDINDEIPF